MPPGRCDPTACVRENARSRSRPRIVGQRAEALVDLGNRFRLLVNEVEAVSHPDLPNLPVARAVWKCKPDFKTACTAWILAGGAHHTAYSYDVTTEMLEDFATIAGIELAVINDDTTLPTFKQDLRNNEVYYHFARGIRA